MENRQATRVGRPGDTILNKIEKVAKGENWSVVVECRDFEGKPLADPENVDFIVTIGENERDENPFIELHTWDPQIALLDPAKASFMASFKRSDQILMAEGVQYYINYWTEPKDKSVEGRMLQARDAIRLLPSVEPKFVSSGRLAAVGFPSLLGSTSLTPYEIDPRDGFSGGKAPVGYVSTIDGVTLAIDGTLVLDRDELVDRDITVTAFDGRGDVRSTIFHQTTYEALSFVGLASVEADRQDGGTVSVVLAGGWAGGYGARTYTANAGTISGSNLILPISGAGETTITVTATDEDGNTVPGSLQLTVEEVAPVIVAPTAAGALADLTLTEGVAMEPIDLSGDFTDGGGTLAFALAPTSAALPAGLSLSAAGVLSGTPNAPVSPRSIVVRATNSAGFADSGFSLTINAAFQNIAGRVSTGTADLVMAPVAGTDPAATTEFFYLTVPATGFSPSTVLKYVFSDATHESYVSFDSSGNTYVGVYARVGGTLQAQQTFSFTTDPLQPNDVAVIALVGSAGGTFALRQSRNNGPWVDGGSVPAAAGAAFPVYGETIKFFGQNVILEGAYVFAFDTLPAILADVASMNAAKASLVGAGGRRPTIDTIKAALGTPVYAIHGPAATITNNPGTAGGTYTLTGTVTDYVPPVPAEFSANLTLSTNRSARLNLPTRTASKVVVMAGSVKPMTGPLNGIRFIERNAATNSVRMSTEGYMQATFQYLLADGVTTSQYLLSSNNLVFALEDRISYLHVHDGNTGKATLHLRKNGGAPVAVPVADTVVGASVSFSGGYLIFRKSDRTIEGSGEAVMIGDALPEGFDPMAAMDTFFVADGRIADLAIMDAALSTLTAIADTRNHTAADWNASLNRGSDGSFASFAGSGTFTDVAPPTSAVTAATLLDGSYYQVLEQTDPRFGASDFDTRLSLRASKTSVTRGEAVFLDIPGLTDEEKALCKFEWDLGDSGEFRYLGTLPWMMRQKNTATGHLQVACWDNVGDVTVYVKVLPPAWWNKKGRILSITITNRDNLADFAGKIHVVSTSGNFTGAPAGATQHTSFEAVINATQNDRALILLKRGETFPYTTATPAHLGATGFTGGYVFDAWGDEASPLPILDISLKGFNMDKPVAPAFLVYRNIRFEAGYDNQTGSGYRAAAFRIRANNFLTLNGCEFVRVKQAIEGIYTDGDIGMYATFNCFADAWENYAIYTADIEYYLSRGCNFCQDPLTVNKNDTKNNLGNPALTNFADHGPHRISGAHVVLISQSKMFSTNGWNYTTSSTDGLPESPASHQPLIRFGASRAEGCDASIMQNFMEGHIAFSGGSNDRTWGAGFMNCAQNYILSTANEFGLGLGHSGLWFHDNFMHIPKVKQERSSQPSIFDASDDDAAVTALWHTKPVRLFNNTISILRDTVDWGNANFIQSRQQMIEPTWAIPAAVAVNGYPAIISYDNLLYTPNLTLPGESGPLIPNGIYDAGAFETQGMYWGKRQIDTRDGSLWTNEIYKTPVDACRLYLLPSTSTLAGTATGDKHAGYDFFGREATGSKRDPGAALLMAA